MEDVVVLVLLAVVIGLYLIHRTVYGSIYEKAQVLSFLSAAPSFSSFSVPDIGPQPPSPLLAYSLSASSPRVSHALWRAVELAMADFVDPWYRKVSSSADFPNDVRHLVDHSFNVAAARAKRVDWTVFIVRNILNNLNYLLKIYRLTERQQRKHNALYQAASAQGRHQLLRAELLRTYRLHPGVTEPEQYLRQVSAAVMSRLLSRRDQQCESLRSLLREMLLAYVLKVGMSFVVPYWMNVSLINILNKQKEMEKEKEKKRAAEAAGAPPAAGAASAAAAAASAAGSGRKKREKRFPPSYIEQVDAQSSARPRTADTAAAQQPVAVPASSFSASTSSLPVVLSSSLPKSSSFSHLVAQGSGEVDGLASAPSSPYPQTASRDASEGEEENEGEMEGEEQGQTGEWAREMKDGDDDAEDGDRDRGSRDRDGDDAKEGQTAAVKAAADGVSDKESLLSQKMQQWNSEREKRSLAASLSTDALADLRRGEKVSSAALSSRDPALTASGPSAASFTSSSAFNAGLPPHHHSRSQSTQSAVAYQSPSFPDSKKSKRSSSSALLVLPPAFLPNFSSVPLSAITSNWEVAIIGAGIKFDPKPFVAYQLHVKNGSTTAQVLQWTMIKRYNQFEELHGRLKRSMSAAFSASLPKKHFFGNLDAEFIRQRKKELDKYLSQLLWNKQVLSSQELRHFLIPNEKDFKDLHKQGASMTVMTPQAAQAMTAAAAALAPPQHAYAALPTPTASPSLSASVSLPSYAASTLSSTSPALVPSSPTFQSVAHLPAGPTRSRSATEDPHQLTSESKAAMDAVAADAEVVSTSSSAASSRPSTAESAGSGALPFTSATLTAAQPLTTSASLSSLSAHHVTRSDASAALPSATSQTAAFTSPPSTPRVPITAGLPTTPGQQQPVVPASALSHTLVPPHQTSGLPLQARPPVSSQHASVTPPRPPGASPGHPRNRRTSRSTPSSHPFASSGASSSSSSSSHRLTRSQYAQLHFEKEMSESLYILVEEMFDLNTKSFVRRQAAWLTKQIVKLTANNVINAYLKTAVAQATSEASVTAQIEWMTDLVWPGGVFKTAGAGVSEEQKEQTKTAARRLLLDSIPGSLKTLLGSQHCEKAMDRFFHFLQMEPLIQHFAFSVLDMLVLTLFPELKGQIKQR